MRYLSAQINFKIAQGGYEDVAFNPARYPGVDLPPLRTSVPPPSPVPPSRPGVPAATLLPGTREEPGIRPLKDFGRLTTEQYRKLTPGQQSKAVPQILETLQQSGMHPFLARLMSRPGLTAAGAGAGLGGVLGALFSRNRAMGALGGSLIGGGLGYLFRGKLGPYIQKWLAARALPSLAKRYTSTGTPLRAELTPSSTELMGRV